MSYCDSTELIRPVSATFETADYAVFASMLSLSGPDEKKFWFDERFIYKLYYIT